MYPVDVSRIYEGERISKEEAYASFGSPKKGVLLLRILDEDEVEDNKVTVDREPEEGREYSIAVLVKIYGKRLESDVEGFFERKMHELANYIQGFMLEGSRDNLQIRISRESYVKGLNLQTAGKIIIDLFKKQYKAIEKMEINFFISEDNVNDILTIAKKIFEEREERVRKLNDESVDVFYICTLCQSHAPNHACVIAPSRPSNCGSISWLEGKAAVAIDPEGGIFEAKKGKVIDEIKGEFEGVNKVYGEKTDKKRVYLHSIFEYPHTSCSCSEAIAFYIPEVDGIGVVDKDFKKNTPLGLDFKSMLYQVSTGAQLEGFTGIGYGYLKSPKFLQGDGGWQRVVWIPKSLKERIYDYIPEDIRDKIATEEDADNIEDLKKFLENRNHPIVKRWKKEKISEVEEKDKKAQKIIAPGGFKIVFEDVDIYIGKIIFKE